MNILVVGGGGREHAICTALNKSDKVEKIYCAPGNGGTASFCENIPVKATDLSGMLEACLKVRPDFVVVTPDDPLALGMVDLLEANGFPCFGPVKAAAEIEASKVFAKAFMERHNIPTAACKVFECYEDAAEYVKTSPLPTVIKADGLAAGKGVLICETVEEALEGLDDIFNNSRFGAAGSRVVIEEFLTGPEVSVLCFTDGTTIVPMAPSQDHKRLLDGDRGPNTGGMGAYSPVPVYTASVAERCMKEIYRPTIDGMAEEGRTFRGVLYFSLMLTPNGPKVIEYNARFGDPETQVVLPLLESDLAEIMIACRDGKLSETEVRFSGKASCCVVLACDNYPAGSRKGLPISGISDAEKIGYVFHAGTALNGETPVTAGGRVLCVSAQADDLRAAVDKAYEGIKKISFDGCYHRNDIAAKAFAEV